MKTSTYFLCFLGIILSFHLNAQCFADINAPLSAISNCNGPQISATATGPGPYQYSWFSPTLTFSSTTSATPNISSATEGWQTITLLIVDANNCTSLVVDSVQFYPFVTTINQTYCTLPDSVCTLDTPVQNLGWTYTDSLGNETNLGATNCVAIIGPGDYEFTGVYPSNCTVIHTYHVELDCSGVSISPISEVLSELIYPNPATHSVSVKLQRASCNAWEILDVFGKICLAGSSQLEEFEIDLSGINAGTYFVRIWYDDHTSTKRLVKD